MDLELETDFNDVEGGNAESLLFPLLLVEVFGVCC